MQHLKATLTSSPSLAPPSHSNSPIISSPLPSAATRLQPLHLSLSLNAVAPPPLSTSSADSGYGEAHDEWEDVFDKLDRARDPWCLAKQDGEDDNDASSSNRPAATSTPAAAAVAVTPLQDSTSLLFPSVRLADVQPNDARPSWLKETSGKVTALAAVRVTLPSTSVEGERGEGNKKKRNRKALRVVVGTEGGAVWLFGTPAPPPCLECEETAGDTSLSTTTTSSARRSSTDLPTLSRRSPSTESFSPLSPTASPPLSPPLSIHRGRHTSLSLSSPHVLPPPLIHRHSNASITSFTSSTGGQHRHPSSSNSIASTSVAAPRPRKASATVSISTSSPLSSDPTGGTTTSTPGVSRPMSPSASSIASSSTGWEPSTRPLSPPLPSLILSPALGGGGGGGKHKKAKDSITTGIGLWETDTANGSRASLSLIGLDGGMFGGLEIDESVAEGGDEEEDEKEEVGEEVELRAVARVLGGSGRGLRSEVVSVKSIDGTGWTRDEGGVAVGVLKRDGTFSLHSVVDGRTFGVVDAGLLRTVGSGVSDWIGFEVVTLAQSKFALLHGSFGTGFLVINLDTLIASTELVEGGTSDSGCALLTSPDGSQSLVFASPPSSPTSTPELIVRSITPFTPTITSGVTLEIGDPHSSGELAGLQGAVRGLKKCGEALLAWDEQGILLFTIRDEVVLPLAHEPLAGVLSIESDGYEALLITTSEGSTPYKVEPAGEGDEVLRFVLVRRSDDSGIEQATLVASSSRKKTTGRSTFLLARSVAAGRVLEKVVLSKTEEGASEQPVRMFESLTGHVNRKDSVTCAKRLDRERVVLGYSSGAVVEIPFAELNSSSQAWRSAPRRELFSAITVLEVVELGGRQVLVAGSVDGSAAAWSLSDWDLLAHYHLFASPVSHIVSISLPSHPSLSHGGLAFISANSPVALVSLFPPQLLFVLPGTSSPVRSLSTSGEDEVLVVYEHGLARAGSVKKQELRRSMDEKTATGVLADGGWTTWFERSSKKTDDLPLGSLSDSILTLDLRAELDDALRLLPWASSSKSKKEAASSIPTNTAQAQSNLDVLRQLLSNVATFGLDHDTDALLVEHLGVKRSEAALEVGVNSSSGTVAFPVTSSPESPWTVSPVATAQRLLQIVCLLRIFLNFPDSERYASQAIVFYASFLQDAVGPSFAFPSLEYLADYWLDKSSEVQQAARSLFGTYLAASSDARVLALVERWQDLLPSRPIENEDACGSADQAVLVIGLVAIERYKLLPATVLKDLSLSIVSYLDDDLHPYHQAIATELCSRGFGIWQNYVDAMLLVRQLFGLATGRNPSTPNELRNLARLATLHVAGVNTPLFMTTLLWDILNAPSATHRNATLKLLGFMIRKKPLVLYTSLPRVAEAVVKSLDPTVTDLRETVHQAATVILNELVRTYPSIDFHGKSQRLAVGTHEGAAIIYDLKTATRLYVLEGHKRPVTALSWSPDGHRLVSVALEESKVVVWKVGVGILSLFMPGAPPRQGSVGGPGGGTPFKTFEFHVGDEVSYSTHSRVLNDATTPLGLRPKLDGDKPVVGSWLMYPGANLARQVASQGFDFVLVDCEHGDIDDGAMHLSVPAIASTGASPIVRVAEANQWLVKRALDTGAHGLMAPLIGTVEQAKAFVSYSKFPVQSHQLASDPNILSGVRGVGSPFAPAVFNQNLSDYVKSANRNIINIVQIESVEGLNNCEEIAKVPGIDMLFIGPNDLATSMGFEPTLHAETAEVQEAIQRVLNACRAAGKYAGMFCTSSEQILARAEQGFDFMNLAFDVMALGAWNAAELAKLEKIR